MRDLAPAFLTGNHDLRLPDWGPYSKKYIGVSHIADPGAGWRFDLSLIPGFYRRKVDIPSVLWESGYHPWEASADLSYFSHRHELEWKDRVFCDITFASPLKSEASARVWRAECVNQTDAPQNLVLHLVASLQKPPLQPAIAKLPGGALWLDALDYDALEFTHFRAQDYLVPGLLLRGEVRESGFVDCSGLGQDFGAAAGDRVKYTLQLSRSFKDVVLLIRFRAPHSSGTALQLEGLSQGQIVLCGEGDFSLHSLSLGQRESGTYALEMTGLGGDAIEIDGFVVCEADCVSQVSFEAPDEKCYPALIPGPVPHSVLIQYPDLAGCYGLRWECEDFQMREFRCDDLDILMRHQVHKHTTHVFEGEGNGHFSDVYLRPIPLEAHSRRALYGMVCSGTRAEVEARLREFNASPSACEAVFEAARLQVASPPSIEAGETYKFSQARMRATLLCNVVYPAYARRSFIKHNTPGRWWDSFYTWDSGFIALGLLELDTRRATDCLNAYMTDPGDPQAAFAHHGSPLPIQHYGFLELWNRTQSRPLLEHFYPRLRGYYEFLSGRDPRSTTARFASGLLQTWDYFYNSGGWDDYPPQVAVHAQELESSVAPVITTAQIIRVAKILRLAAAELRESGDVATYNADIERFSAALAPAWDENEGYFGYMRHDSQGEAQEILRHGSGANFNRGLDGAYPLVAGICTAEQEKRLISHLFDEREMWTPIGLSTVDQTAPYFKPDGYWNGAVWMPHQWFFWKILLDLGQSERAWQIAHTALEIWKAEVENSYGCFEHFIVQSGRGAGWHQFGGLSAPVLNWFASYYTPGTLTVGFDVWVNACEWSENHNSLHATLKRDQSTSRAFTLIAVMNPAYRYRVRWNGEIVAIQTPHAGALQISIGAGTSNGELEIERV